jgi:hypothetical protein
VDGERGEHEEGLNDICEHSADLLHVAFLLLPQLDDLLQLSGSAVREDLDVAPAHGDAVGEEVELALQPFRQAAYLPRVLLN